MHKIRNRETDKIVIGVCVANNEIDLLLGFDFGDYYRGRDCGCEWFNEGEREKVGWH